MTWRFLLTSPPLVARPSGRVQGSYRIAPGFIDIHKT